jgi:GMP synthase-like glutamine amidotransferase
MRILVFQHLRVEHPGVFRELWTEAGHTWVPVALDEGEAIPSLDGFDLMAVMGGPMDVWQEDLHPWLIDEKAAIRRWVKELERPFLGICLGHQLLAASLGGHVTPMARPEVGLTEVELTPCGRADPLLTGLDPRVGTLQWHGAEISRLPDGAEILASNAACPTQAVRWGRHAYGFQFHIETTPATVADWIRIPEYAASLQQSLGFEAASQLAETVAPKLPGFHNTASRINENLDSIVTDARRSSPTAGTGRHR